MTKSSPLTRDTLKIHAKRLRSNLAARGHALTHAQALEMIAYQWGVRDWNTLSAQAKSAQIGWSPGQRVSGEYLGRPFRGVVKTASKAARGYWRITVRFDQEVDVVTSSLFSAFRKHVSATLNAKGSSPLKTSDGRAHMVLHPW
ncbi:MAG: glyoxalase superfamily protein [Pseudomonadota bacterium]